MSKIKQTIKDYRFERLKREVRGIHGSGGDIAAAIAAHEAAANPHPIYLTQTEADALYGRFIPTYIASGTTFTVPANTQALFSHPIEIDGTLDISGAFIEVS